MNRNEAEEMAAGLNRVASIRGIANGGRGLTFN